MIVTFSDHKKLAGELESLRTFLQGLSIDKATYTYPADKEAAKKVVEVLQKLSFFFRNLSAFKTNYYKQLKEFNIHLKKVEVEDFKELANYRRRLVNMMKSILPHLEGLFAYMQQGMDDVNELNKMLEELKVIEKEQQKLIDSGGLLPWDSEKVLEQDRHLVNSSLGTVNDIHRLANNIVDSLLELHCLTY